MAIISFEWMKSNLVPKKKKRARWGLSSGSTLLNLCISGQPDWAYKPGTMHHIVGDSTSGKTFLTLTAGAEASVDSHFKDYKIIYDPAEDGAQMDLSKYFGRRFAERVKRPPLKDPKQESCYMLEEMGACMKRLLDDKRPFLYIEDSIDALTCKKELKEAEDEQLSADKGVDAKGTYGTHKAIWLSKNLRWIIPKLKEKKDILFLISQAKETIGFGAMFKPKTYAGGKSLKFYAQTQIWTSVIETLKKKNVRGKDYKIGIVIGVKVVKNRMTGKDWDIKLPFYYSHGIDDTGSCVDFLIENKHIKKRKKGIVADCFDFTGTREGLIQHIEDNDMENDLTTETVQVWREIEEACAINRKRKYD